VISWIVVFWLVDDCFLIEGLLTDGVLMIDDELFTEQGFFVELLKFCVVSI